MRQPAVCLRFGGVSYTVRWGSSKPQWTQFLWLLRQCSGSIADALSPFEENGTMKTQHLITNINREQLKASANIYRYDLVESSPMRTIS